VLWSLNDQLKLTFIQHEKGPKGKEVHSLWVKTLTAVLDSEVLALALSQPALASQIASALCLKPE